MLHSLHMHHQLRMTGKLPKYLEIFNNVTVLKINRYELEIGFKIKGRTTLIRRPLNRSKCTVNWSMAQFKSCESIE